MFTLGLAKERLDQLGQAQDAAQYADGEPAEKHRLPSGTVTVRLSGVSSYPGRFNRPLTGRADHQSPCLCDALGNPVRLILTAGQAADVTQGAALVEAIPTGTVIADKGYDSDALCLVPRWLEW